MFEIRHFVTDMAKDVYLDWFLSLRDSKVRIAIDRRIKRIELGNFGDHKFCRDGVWELRIDAGPGFRVYYAKAENKIVLLLCGGDKKTQDADISLASKYWQDWQRRPSDER